MQRIITHENWIGGLPDPVREAVLARMVERVVEPGEIVAEAGRDATRIFQVVEGYVRLTGLHEDGSEALITIYVAGNCYTVQVERTIKQILEQISALLILARSRRLVELREQKGALAGKDIRLFTPTVLYLSNTAHLRFNGRALLCARKRGAQLLCLLRDGAGLIFVLREMKSCPVRCDVDDFAHDGIDLASLPQLFQQHRARVPFRSLITRCRIALGQEPPDQLFGDFGAPQHLVCRCLLDMRKRRDRFQCKPLRVGINAHEIVRMRSGHSGGLFVEIVMPSA